MSTLIRRTVSTMSTLSTLSTLSAVLLAAQPGGPPASEKPAILREVGIDQRLNERLPLDLRFRDEEGRDVRLGDYLGRRPVVLALVYYECPMLCTQVLNGLVSALTVMSLDAGREFDVVAVSFDPKEGPGLARAKKQSYLERYGRPGTAAGWHFLTGGPESIERLTKAVGFRYVYDEKRDQFAHGAAITVVTPSGVISRYFYGIEYAPRDLRLGLVEASADRIGSIADQVLLLCYHYDPATGRYGFVALTLVRIGGILTIAAFGVFLWLERTRVRLKPDTTRVHTAQ
ncbi:MAG: SCO family protein [Vicinamibacterales bacterium]